MLLCGVRVAVRRGTRRCGASLGARGHMEPPVSPEAAAMADMGLPTGFDTTHGEAKPAPQQEEAPAGKVRYTAYVDDFQGGPGQKLAEFAAEAFPELKWSKNKARGEAKAGLLRVNGKQAGANKVLMAADVVTVHKVAKVQWRNGMWSSTYIADSGNKANADGSASKAAFGVNLGVDGKCNKRMRGINCGCPDCASLSEADKKKLRNRKKKEAKARKEAAAAAAAPGGEGSVAAEGADVRENAEASGAPPPPPSAAAAAATPAPEGGNTGPASTDTKVADTVVQGAAEPAASASAAAATTADWVAGVDLATGHPYWYDRVSGSSSWTAPPGWVAKEVPKVSWAAKADATGASIPKGQDVAAASAAASSKRKANEAESSEESEMESEEEHEGARLGMVTTTARLVPKKMQPSKKTKPSLGFRPTRVGCVSEDRSQRKQCEELDSSDEEGAGNYKPAQYSS